MLDSSLKNLYFVKAYKKKEITKEPILDPINSLKVAKWKHKIGEIAENQPYSRAYKIRESIDKSN